MNMIKNIFLKTLNVKNAFFVPENGKSTEQKKNPQRAEIYK